MLRKYQYLTFIKYFTLILHLTFKILNDVHFFNILRLYLRKALTVLVFGTDRYPKKRAHTTRVANVSASLIGFLKYF